MDVNNPIRRTFIWLPSSAPDLVERRLWDRLSRFEPIVCRTAQQAAERGRNGAIVALANGPSESWSPASVLETLEAETPGAVFFLRHRTLPLSVAAHLGRRGAAGVFGPEADDSAVAAEVESALGGFDGVNESWRSGLIGESEAMQAICSTIRMIAQRRGTVLITGETGTGKEVVAHAIHAAGNRASQPFVAVNCSAIPGTLLESELFGHTKGAFTGASGQRIGRFEQAQHGTIFLDEIGDLELELQTKLLRVLQERQLERLGSSDTIRLDVRVIAATHMDLMAKVRSGSFREDLYYRLNVIPVEIPPLRERTSDIPLIAGHLIRKICRLEQIPLRTLSQGALLRLMEYSWPGNIRELENCLERAAALSEGLALTEADFDLPAQITASDAESRLPECGLDYEAAVSRFEWKLLSEALRKSGGNKKAAADMLGLKRTTLAAKVKNLSNSAPILVM